LSIQDISWALRQDVRPAGAKLLLIALANYTNEHHVCWPSKTRLALDCSMDKRQICRHLAELQEKGLVKVEERYQDGAQITSLVTLSVTQCIVTPSVVEDTPPSGVDVTPPVAQKTPPQWRGRHTEPSLEPSMNLKNISDEDFERFWKAYPRRDGPNPKATALTAWKKAVKKEDAETILTATTAYAKECEVKGIVKTQFVPMASTWLNQERWNDVTTGGANGLTDDRRKELESILNA
jgi:hypothetical protein